MTVIYLLLLIGAAVCFAAAAFAPSSVRFGVGWLGLLLWVLVPLLQTFDRVT